MKLGLTFLTTAAAFILLGAVTATAADASADGKAAFTELKCGSCHSVTVADIKPAPPAEGEEADEAIDLSKVGAKRDAAWIKDYLNKKADIDGKQHRKKFAGTPAQLDALAGWLSSLK